jgi:glycosyltransferase involved in cell wall biosynthesis
MGESTNGTPWLTVLMPAYNEASGLAQSAGLVLAKLREMAIPAELLIVDDCSRDGTAEIADALAAAEADVRVIHHPENRGIGGGMVTGFAAARGEWLILIPADLALDLDELNKYWDAAQQADIVVGIRSDRSDYDLMRKVVSWVNIRAIQVLFGMRQRQFNYISMYRLDALREMRIEYWHSAFFYAEIMIKATALGRRLVEVDIQYVPRGSGEATGAKPAFILRTMTDMLRFWLRWVLMGPKGAAMFRRLAEASCD